MGVFDHTIILAGGAGNRLWPASSNERPKYLLEIAPDTSLLRATLERAIAVTQSTVVIVTHHRHASLIMRHIEGEQWNAGQRVVVLQEPRAQNTGPALALAVLYLKEYCGGGTALCMPADHIISPLERFTQDAGRALALARKQKIALFGIKPHTINSGYGHIEVGSEIGENSYTIKKFHEKPDRVTAERYMKSGNFYWNSGFFAFDIAHMWREYQAHEPRISTVFQQSSAEDAPLFSFEEQAPALLLQRTPESFDATYQKLPSISIDHAIAERSQQVAMVKANFEWNDVGSWDEIARLIEEKIIENPKHGVAPICYEAQNNTVISDHLVAICGIDDLLIIEEDGIIMICKKGHSQDVKQLALTYAAEQRGKRRPS